MTFSKEKGTVTQDSKGKIKMRENAQDKKKRLKSAEILKNWFSNPWWMRFIALQKTASRHDILYILALKIIAKSLDFLVFFCVYLAADERGIKNGCKILDCLLCKYLIILVKSPT